jgi:hypothetical protein
VWPPVAFAEPQAVARRGRQASLAPHAHGVTEIVRGGGAGDYSRRQEQHGTTAAPPPPHGHMRPARPPGARLVPVLASLLACLCWCRAVASGPRCPRIARAGRVAWPVGVAVADLGGQRGRFRDGAVAINCHTSPLAAAPWPVAGGGTSLLSQVWSSRQAPLARARPTLAGSAPASWRRSALANFSVTPGPVQPSRRRTAILQKRKKKEKKKEDGDGFDFRWLQRKMLQWTAGWHVTIPSN